MKKIEKLSKRQLKKLQKEYDKLEIRDFYIGDKAKNRLQARRQDFLKACYYGDFKMVKGIIKSADKSKRLALVSHKDLVYGRQKFDARLDLYWSGLDYAAYYGYKKIEKLLIKHGAIESQHLSELRKAGKLQRERIKEKLLQEKNRTAAA